jgi:hypothetical protein
MQNEFTSVMAALSDSELVKIITEQREVYQPEALKAADQEFENRKLSKPQMEAALNELKLEKFVSDNKVYDPAEDYTLIDKLFIVFMWPLELRNGDIHSKNPSPKLSQKRSKYIGLGILIYALIVLYTYFTSK